MEQLHFGSDLRFSSFPPVDGGGSHWSLCLCYSRKEINNKAFYSAGLKTYSLLQLGKTLVWFCAVAVLTEHLKTPFPSLVLAAQIPSTKRS